MKSLQYTNVDRSDNLRNMVQRRDITSPKDYSRRSKKSAFETFQECDAMLSASETIQECDAMNRRRHVVLPPASWS